jgi:hypothetical protein
VSHLPLCPRFHRPSPLQAPDEFQRSKWLSVLRRVGDPGTELLSRTLSRRMSSLPTVEELPAGSVDSSAGGRGTGEGTPSSAFPVMQCTRTHTTVPRLLLLTDNPDSHAHPFPCQSLMR